MAYLDNSATTRPTERVIRAMAEALSDAYFNPSSLYAPALIVEKKIKAARAEILSALMDPPGQIVFTSGGTEGNNLAILGSAAAMHGKRHFIATAQEHPSVLSAFDALRGLGHTVTLLPVDEAGQVPEDALISAIESGGSPALFSCMQVNNETGAAPDIARLGDVLKKNAPDALFHVDGVQGFLRANAPIKGVDLYTMSAHKVHGPKGIGALYVRRGVRLLPRLLGGGQEDDLRSGTENTPGIVGFLEAVREMRKIMPAAALREKKMLLSKLLIECIPEAIVNGPAPEDGAPHILNVSFPGVRAEVLLHALESHGVYVSTGAACSSRKRKSSAVLAAMGIPPARTESALRFSLSPFTTEDEIAFAAERASEAYAQLRLVKRR